MIQSRFYNVSGKRWEARFFRKGELFPDTSLSAPRQGVWAREAPFGWEAALFVGHSWGKVDMTPDVLYLEK